VCVSWKKRSRIRETSLRNQRIRCRREGLKKNPSPEALRERELFCQYWGKKKKITCEKRTHEENAEAISQTFGAEFLSKKGRKEGAVRLRKEGYRRQQSEARVSEAASIGGGPGRGV